LTGMRPSQGVIRGALGCPVKAHFSAGGLHDRLGVRWYRSRGLRFLQFGGRKHIRERRLCRDAPYRSHQYPSQNASEVHEIARRIAVFQPKSVQIAQMGVRKGKPRMASNASKRALFACPTPVLGPQSRSFDPFLRPFCWLI
jgi:hypothetical protein